MQPTPFDPKDDLPPLPFEARHCEAAARLKAAGLIWRPHVGCFAWDRDEHLPVPSPFPRRIYFILNLGHFLRMLGSLEQVQTKLIWLPTWHQARLLAAQKAIPWSAMADLWGQSAELAPGDELLALYDILLQSLKKG